MCVCVFVRGSVRLVVSSVLYARSFVLEYLATPGSRVEGERIPEALVALVPDG